MTDFPIQPFQDRVIVKVCKTPEKLGSLFVVQTRTNTTEGIVVSVGDGAPLKRGGTRPLDVKIGERVLFEPMGSTEVRIEGELHLVIRESQVLGVIETPEMDGQPRS